MSDEWFKRKKDEDAVLVDLGPFFDRMKETRKRECRTIFRRAWRVMYKNTKRTILIVLQGDFNFPEFKRELEKASVLYGAENRFRGWPTDSIVDEPGILHRLGQATGFWLAFVDYGLIDIRYKEFLEKTELSKRLILENLETMVKKLRETLKKYQQYVGGFKPQEPIQFTFVARRLSRITSKHEDITEDQQRLFREMAELFIA